MADGANVTHNIGDVYKRINETDNRVTAVATTLENFIHSSESRSDNLDKTISEGLRAIRDDLGVERALASRPFPWIGVIGLLLTSFIILGLLFGAVISPIKENQTLIVTALKASNDLVIKDNFDDGYSQGVTDAYQEVFKDLLNKANTRLSVVEHDMSTVGSLISEVKAKQSRDYDKIGETQSWLGKVSTRSDPKRPE